MTRLQAEPAIAVRSLDELRALALAMERTAVDRYEQLAISLGNAGQTDMAEVCRRLASRAASLPQEPGKAPVPHAAGGNDQARPQWPHQPIFDDEGLATASPQLINPYRLLSTAVRNAERAFAFWSYVVAHAVNGEIRHVAERLAHGELDRVAALRRERRAAFHAERAGHVDAAEYDTSTNSLVQAEQALMAHIERLEMASEPRFDRRAEFAHDGRRNIVFLETHSALMARGGSVKMSKDVDALDIAEFLAEAYLEGADRLRQEDLVSEAQTMTGRAIERLAWLRDMPRTG